MVMFLETTEKIRSDDCDINDNLKMSKVLDFFCDIAGAHADILNVGFEKVYNQGLYWVILYQQFEVVGRLPKYGDKITLKTWPKQGNRVYVLREHEILDEEGNLLIKGIVSWGLIDTVNRKMARADSVQFEGEYYDRTNYDTKGKLKVGVRPIDLMQESSYRVLKTDVDHNKHMNNARYLDVVYNIDNIKEDYKKVEISFAKENYLNDDIKIKYYQEDNLYYYIGYTKDDILSFEVKIEV